MTIAKQELLINDEIREKEVRVIDSDGAQLGIISLKDALAIAAEKNLDLVEIAPTAHYNEDPFHIEGPYKEAMMPAGTAMVPRVFKTNVGDIFTTNTINATTLAVGDTLKVGANGILEPGTDDKMTWQVVKVYTMPDHQNGVKIMRIA